MSETLQNPTGKEVVSKPDPLKELYNYSFDEKESGTKVLLKNLKVITQLKKINLSFMIF